MNWLEFFDAQGVEYTLRSPNTRVGEVSVSCPFCADDPSYHMGISLTEHKWGCWRDGSHRGKNPLRLVRALLGCSHEMATLIIDQFSKPDPENLDDAIALLQGFTVDKPPPPPTHLAFPSEFKEVGVWTRYYTYLMARGFCHIEAFCDFYGIKCCDTGIWHDRVIFPITYEGKLVSWVGRAIGSVINAPRYRILPTKEGALVERNTMIFNEGNLTGAKFLFVTEGPIDALKLDWHGSDLAQATCIFGTHLSSYQAGLLGQIRKKYDRAILLLDSDATAATFQASEALQHYGFEFGTLPHGIKDPGEIKWRDIEAFLENL